MFLGTGIIGDTLQADVQTPFVDLDNTGVGIATVYSGIRWDSDGGIYRMDPNGNFQYDSDWLLSGAASTYYLQRTIDDGTLTNDDGDGVQLNTDNLDYWITNSLTWFTRVAKVTFGISTDAPGSNLIASRQYTLSAELQGTGSPP